jgi:alkanesulfonate monooxygenase SsuD/methylene tetrahydromethanopterin reductase-like flavin-dependent oxidoreductase (luciferase family)
VNSGEQGRRTEGAESNIWARDPMAMAAAQKTLCEAYPERFLLGMGVSHGPMVGMRGHTYDKPLTYMRNYLDQMDLDDRRDRPAAQHHGTVDGHVRQSRR